MAQFLNNLSSTMITEEIERLDRVLSFYSDILGQRIDLVPPFYCDKESIPRIPVVYAWLGHTTKRGGFVHDWLYRHDCPLRVSRAKADAIYRECCIASGMEYLKSTKGVIKKVQVAKVLAQAWTKWLGVRIGGRWSYHKKSVNWKPEGVNA